MYYELFMNNFISLVYSQYTFLFQLSVPLCSLYRQYVFSSGGMGAKGMMIFVLERVCSVAHFFWASKAAFGGGAFSVQW